MTWFLLGMLVMWFCYPLLKATQTTMVMKWTNLTINKEEIDENTTIGFRIGGQYGCISIRNCMVWKHGCDLYLGLCCVLYV